MIVFSFPVNSLILQKIGFEKNSIYEIFFINFLIFSTLCLFFSIINLNYNLLFVFYLISGGIFLLRNIIIDFKIFSNFFFLLFFFVNISIYLEIASYPILNWDGLATWSLKMNNFLFKQSFQNLENITYNHQPHLGPYM